MNGELEHFAEEAAAAFGMQEVRQDIAALDARRMWADLKHVTKARTQQPKIWLYTTTMRVYGKYWIIDIDWDEVHNEWRMHARGDLSDDIGIVLRLLRSSWNPLQRAWSEDRLRATNLGWARQISGIGKSPEKRARGPRDIEEDAPATKPVFGQPPPKKGRKRT